MESESYCLMWFLSFIPMSLQGKNKQKIHFYVSIHNIRVCNEMRCNNKLHLYLGLLMKYCTLLTTRGSLHASGTPPPPKTNTITVAAP